MAKLILKRIKKEDHLRKSIIAFYLSHRDNSLFSLKKKCIEHLECARLCVEVNKVIFLGFPGGSVVKNLPASAGDTGSIPGVGRSHMLWSR